MTSQEDSRRLHNSITALQEKVDELQKYAMVLSQEPSKFNSDHLLKHAAALEELTNECRNAYNNYINR